MVNGCIQRTQRGRLTMEAVWSVVLDRAGDESNIPVTLKTPGLAAAGLTTLDGLQTTSVNARSSAADD